MNVAIYARVSTRDKGQDTENQMRELRQFAEASGWAVTREYVDTASGSGKVDRPEFARMFADAAKKRFKLVLFWSLDRFTREGTLKTLEYLQTLTKYGVAWRSLQEQYIDSAGPFRDAVISIMACIAQQERLRIAERTRAGMETARRKGASLGRPRSSVDVAQVIRMHQAGDGVGKISRALGNVSRETIRRLVKDHAAA